MSLEKEYLILMPAEKKRTFKELRAIILLALYRGQKTTNQISYETGVNWKTVENHLTFLKGKGYVKEVFSSSYVRIFEITSNGKSFVQEIEHIYLETDYSTLSTLSSENIAEENLVEQ